MHQWWCTHRGDEVARTAAALKAARAVREKLNATPLKNVIYVAGIAGETPAGLRFNGDDTSPKWEVTAEGDGTVPYALGLLQCTEERMDTYYLDALHGDLANHQLGFEAIGELLAKGSTNKLPTTLTPSARGAGQRDGVLCDDAPLLFPHEEDLLCQKNGKVATARRTRSKASRHHPHNAVNHFGRHTARSELNMESSSKIIALVMARDP
jgi:hypothetical protein